MQGPVAVSFKYETFWAPAGEEVQRRGGRRAKCSPVCTRHPNHLLPPHRQPTSPRTSSTAATCPAPRTSTRRTSRPCCCPARTSRGCGSGARASSAPAVSRRGATNRGGGEGRGTASVCVPPLESWLPPSPGAALLPSQTPTRRRSSSWTACRSTRSTGRRRHAEAVCALERASPTLPLPLPPQPFGTTPNYTFNPATPFRNDTIVNTKLSPPAVRRREGGLVSLWSLLASSPPLVPRAALLLDVQARRRRPVRVALHAAGLVLVLQQQRGRRPR